MSTTNLRPVGSTLPPAFFCCATLLTLAARTAVGALPVLAVWLIARRLSIIESRVLTGPEVVGLLSVLLFVLMPGGLRDRVRCRSPFDRGAWVAVSLSAWLLLMAAVPWGERSLSATAAVWLPALVVELFFWRVKWNDLRGAPPVPVAAALIPNDASTPREVEDADSADTAEEETLLPPDVSQQLTRSRDESGTDVLAGLLRVNFVPGEQTAAIHLAFCPPFVTPPKVAALVVEGPESDVRTTLTETFGARLEVRRSSPLTAGASVILHVTAGSPQSAAD